MYADCTNDKCVLNSTTTKTQLPIEKMTNRMLLYAEDNCVVNFVEIIHDCVPRIVGLTLMFERNDHDESDLVYLKVKNLNAY